MAIYQNLDVRNIPGEQWKTIEEFHSKQYVFMISNLGRVKRITKSTGKKRIKAQQNNGKGYLYVQFHKKNYYIHRLVGQYFIPNPNNKTTVNHRNFRKWDNRVVNLEFATQKEQINHAYENGGMSNNTPIIVIDTNAEIIGEYRSRFELKDIFGHINHSIHDVPHQIKYEGNVWFKDNKAFIAKSYYETLTEDEKFIIATECLEFTLRFAFLVDGQLVDGVKNTEQFIGCSNGYVTKQTKDKLSTNINGHSVSRLKNMIGVGV